MPKQMGRLLAIGIAGAFIALPAAGQALPNQRPFPNPTGLSATFDTAASLIDVSGPFFQSLGSNGRSCSTCHRPAEGWTVSATGIQLRFTQTQGTDPIFRTNDGSNCDHGIDTSTVEARRNAYSLLIEKGLIRVALPVPAGAEFDVLGVANPYGCSDTATLSVYRRPLPAANLRLLSAVMWDGRESSVQTGTQPITRATNPDDLRADLAHQAMDAANGHAQAVTPLTAQQQQAIVNFEMSLATAQALDKVAEALDTGGAKGGPVNLGSETMPAFFVGINDPLGAGPFTPAIFSLFEAWTNQSGGEAQQRRASIARGQSLFNSKPVRITGVAGLNDDLHAASIQGTCGTCHNTPNAGNHSVALAINIGVSDLDNALGLSYLPVITLQNRATHEIVMTTDPGRALITGRWKDIGKLKGPVLRGLASRAPYFHNGSATSLDDVLDFYERRFGVGFTAQEREDLIAFLNSL